jgi:hypothetical protein
VIGGDGTIRFCEILHKEIKRRKLCIALCVIPKSTTNDIPIIDKSFGFETAVEETQKALEAGYNESQSHLHGVGKMRIMKVSSRLWARSQASWLYNPALQQGILKHASSLNFLSI